MAKIQIRNYTQIMALIISIIIFFLCLCYASQCWSNVIYNDAVQDSNKNFLRDKNGNCVRTKWETTFDPCREKIYVVELLENMYESKIYFDFDKYNLKDSEKEKIRAVAEVIKEHQIEAIKIVGYTDKIGGDEYNHKLSHKRADAVRDYLCSLVTLKSSRIEIGGFGKAKPIKTCPESLKGNALINCLAPNRRAEVEVDYMD